MASGYDYSLDREAVGELLKCNSNCAASLDGRRLLFPKC